MPPAGGPGFHRGSGARDAAQAGVEAATQCARAPFVANYYSTLTSPKTSSKPGAVTRAGVSDKKPLLQSQAHARDPLCLPSGCCLSKRVVVVISATNARLKMMFYAELPLRLWVALRVRTVRKTAAALRARWSRDASRCARQRTHRARAACRSFPIARGLVQIYPSAPAVPAARSHECREQCACSVGACAAVLVLRENRRAQCLQRPLLA
jgi:hypothetical protein